MGKVIGGFFVNLFTGLVSSLFTHTLATLACLYSIVGGMSATGTWIGDVIRWAINLGPWWTAYAAVVAGLIFFCGDLGKEGVPNALAIFLPLFIPSAATAVPDNGKLHDLFNDWIDATNKWLDGSLGEWIGGPGQEAVLTVIAVTAFVFAGIAQWRYLKGKGGTSTSTSTSTSTTPSGVRSRRARP